MSSSSESNSNSTSTSTPSRPVTIATPVSENEIKDANSRLRTVEAAEQLQGLQISSSSTNLQSLDSSTPSTPTKKPASSSSSSTTSPILSSSSFSSSSSSTPLPSGTSLVINNIHHFYLDGITFTPETLVSIGHDETCIVHLTDSAWTAVRTGRAVVDSIINNNEIAYGINTGFGNFANVIIPNEELAQLQANLIRSHAAGVGLPLSVHKTRMLLALRINVLAKGHSGIREETLRAAINALNANCLSYVPCKGTVGASGDLAPLSHLALGLMGEGRMFNPTTRQFEAAAAVLASHGLKPIQLQAKEGLALINGTQLITSIGVEAVVRARSVALQADVVAALTIEALKGSARPFHPSVHSVRPHHGQSSVAGRLRCLLNFNREPSEITLSHVGCGKVQDAYTMRCIPQIHGIVHDTVEFAYGILATECNSATDNPMIFAELEKGQEYAHPHATDVCVSSTASHSRKGVIISGGNFHGEYPAKALDYLTIGIHEIASVSERRIERLVNPHLSGLPAFLVHGGGLNSGYMIAHCTAAALVSENKTLCHPASVDSLSTSAAQEDHVSMGGFAARKALKVVGHVEYCIAIELLCACQAIDLLRPLHTTKPLERVVELVRSVVPIWDRDRHMSPDIEAVVKLIRDGQIWKVVETDIEQQYRQ